MNNLIAKGFFNTKGKDEKPFTVNIPNNKENQILFNFLNMAIEKAVKEESNRYLLTFNCTSITLGEEVSDEKK